MTLCSLLDRTCVAPSVSAVADGDRYTDHVHRANFVSALVVLCRWVRSLISQAKYGKLAYSAQFGFSTSTGPHGLRQVCPDSTLALSDDKDEVYWRVRYSCTEVEVRENGVIRGVWKPWSELSHKPV